MALQSVATSVVGPLAADPAYAALCLPPQIAAPVVVDVSSPNIAKKRHVRSTTIGDLSLGEHQGASRHPPKLIR